MKDYEPESKPKEILLASGYPSYELDSSITMLCRASTLFDLKKARHQVRFGMDHDQFLFPLMQPLITASQDFRDRIPGGIGEEFLNRQELQYFLTELGPQHLPIAGMEFSGRFDSDTEDKFPQSYRQVIFEALKGVLC